MPRETIESRRKTAESLAIHALTFLVEEPERISRFFALTGIDPGEVRNLAREPGFLAAVLEHLRSDERLLMEFAKAAEVRPQDIAAAAALLSGPAWERDSA
jgi:hypothetical protein